MDDNLTSLAVGVVVVLAVFALVLLWWARPVSTWRARREGNTSGVDVKSKTT